MEVETKPVDNVERQLVEKLSIATKKVADLEALLKLAEEEENTIEAELMELLDDQGKQASARYEDLGHVTCVKPVAYAQIKKGEEEYLFASLKEMGREDLIKTTVNTTSLSVLVREKLETNQVIPNGCTYYLKRSLRFFPIK